MKDGQLLFATSRVGTAAGTTAVALLAGFVASIAMVLAFGVAYGAALMISSVPVPILSTWFAGLTHNPLIDVAGPNLYAATGLFFLGGLLWALIYGLVAEPRLAGAGWQRGITFALIPYAFSLIVVLPLVGGGFLGLGLGAGPLPIVGNLILHIVYGACLGAIVSSADSVVDRPAHQAFADDLHAAHLSEVAAARGVVAGLVLGILLGLVGAVLIQSGVGVNPLGLVVAVALTGATFGGFIGSFATRA